MAERSLDAEVEELLRERRVAGPPVIPETEESGVAPEPRRGGGTLAGVLLIACGALLLIGQLTTLPGSVFLGTLGLAFLAARLFTGRYGFAVPAGLLLALAAFVFYTERWSELAGTPATGGWFFLSMAAGFAAVYAIGGRPAALWPAFPAVALAAVGILLVGALEMSFLAPHAWIGAYWPASLLLIGGWLLVRDRVDESLRRPLALLGSAAIVLYAAAAVGASIAAGLERGAFVPFGAHGIRIGDPTAVRGSGTVVTQARQISGVSGVVLAGGGDVMIRQGTVEGLTVEAEDNLQALLTSDVRGGVLTLGSERSIWPTKPIRYTITVRRLERVALNGGGTLSASGIDADRLRVALDGGGALTLSGRAATQEVTLSGAGRYDAGELATREATIELNGAGYVLVNASERLRAEVNGVGVVEYTGSPQVERSINGLGTVRRRA
ncbi:MAG TPA: head GIN domain-containing protein [Chloroflexota bacterium]|nr:head GIN domain-containing protein [Chloroflexota bacterium]